MQLCLTAHCTRFWPCTVPLQYRARQKRLIANSSRQQHDRSRMMREVEESLRRWGPRLQATLAPCQISWNAAELQPLACV